MTAGQASFEELLEDRFSTSVTARLVRYAELVERWSQTHSLVHWRSREDFVERHLLESLAARDLLGRAGALADVGSGAGLPGIPLLIACGGWRGTLIEPRSKRWAFLRHVIRELDLDAVALRCRYHEVGTEVGRYDVVTMRALGGAAELLGWARGRLTENGSVLLWSTDEGLEELERLAGWRVVSSALPCLERGRLIQTRPCFT